MSSVSDYPQLINTLSSDQKIVYLCGAGASMSLGNHSLSWGKWILAGKEYLSDSDKAELDKLLGSWTTEELIVAVTFLLEKLKASGCYKDFMNSTIGSLHPSEPLFKDALRKICRSGDIITSTNYDLQIEEAANIGGVSYSTPSEILSILNSRKDGKVIHLHGMYDKLHDVDDIIADDPQYKRILANTGAQFIQNLIGTHPIIVVGCGGTLEDPNLSGFLSFLVDHLGETHIPYFFLVKTGDSVPDLPPNAIPIFYGEKYSDLPSFLLEISEYRLRKKSGIGSLVAINPYQDHSLVTSAFGRMHFSNRFCSFVGRVTELMQLDDFLEADGDSSWWAVTGVGGIGKSRLVLEWLKSMPVNWFGFFTKKEAIAVNTFTPFADTVVVLDYVVGRERECAQTVEAYIDVFRDSKYKLRILFIEREDGKWIDEIKQLIDHGMRIHFDSGWYCEPLVVTELAHSEEITYVENYLKSYLPLLPDNSFIDDCRADIELTSTRIADDYRTSLLPSCQRPLYLSVYTEVWMTKEGNLSIESAEELLTEFIVKERNRWEVILETEELTDSYLRLLSVACAIAFFNITDLYGNNYLEDDCRNLTMFLDKKSGRPGADNTFSDLFISMHELVSDDESEDDTFSVIDIFANPEKSNGHPESIDTSPIMEISEEDRFAYSTPYIKLDADPHEVYLNMLKGVDAAEDEELQELERVREERIRRVDALPDHAWVITPVFPDIIKEFIVSYVINERDLVKFTKLARSNSILGFDEFITRALDDWPENKKFQKMVVTPPDEMLNYFEYYASLLQSLYRVEDIKAVEHALINSDTCFPKFEIELWRRIAIVLTNRDDIGRLYDSSCNLEEYIKSIDGLKHIRDEVADVISAYCVGFYNAEEEGMLFGFLQKCTDFKPDSVIVGRTCCENYNQLIHLKKYHNKNADSSREWDAVLQLLQKYNYPEIICKEAAKTAHEYLHELIEKNDLEGLQVLEKQLESIFEKQRIVEVAEIAALCSANICSISYEYGSCINKEYDKVKDYYSLYPKAMRIRLAFIVTARVVFLETSVYRKVPETIMKRAKRWSHQYPNEIEFQESYFGLLLACLEYAQARDMKGEEKKIFTEMKTVAAKADYSEYEEENDLLGTIEMLKQIYGYK